MIEPPGFRGAVFGTAADGDPRLDPGARDRYVAAFGLADALSWANQVHGSTILTVETPGAAGDGDGLHSDQPGLGLVVATADCVPVIIEGERSSAIIHAGWRGLAAGVVSAALDELRRSGDTPLRAAIGPSIGPCCYEVGEDVAAALAPFAASTSWGTGSVDLWSAAEAQLEGVEHVWRAELCTFTDHRFLSYRRDGTADRQVSITWVPLS
jgi:purine-nucleoside/S-methyl-5'-thioadenosine phosphorylase / adenosine deaminase